MNGLSVQWEILMIVVVSEQWHGTLDARVICIAISNYGQIDKENRQYEH